MLSRKTCESLHSATFSRELVSGATRFDALGGQTILQFGQVLALANLSARRAKAMGLLMSGICGPHGTTSSTRADRKPCWVSRLRARTDLLGSTLYKLTWRDRVTPAGRSIYALRASVLRTSANDFGSWPTPTTRDHKGKSGAGRQERKGHPPGHAAERGSANYVADTPSERGSRRAADPGGQTGRDGPKIGGTARRVAHPDRTGLEQGSEAPTTAGHGRATGATGGNAGTHGPGPTNGHWREADWLGCRDNKWRAVEPGTCPLVDGAPARVGRLRGYGNAINAEAATEFIRSLIS